MKFACEVFLVVISGCLIPGGVYAVFAILRMTRENKARRTARRYQRLREPFA